MDGPHHDGGDDPDGPDNLDDDGVDFSGPAMEWLRGISSFRAGPDTAAIHVPDVVKQSLLNFYSDAVLKVSRGDFPPGEGPQQGLKAEKDSDVRGENDDAERVDDDADDPEDEDNDVPRRMAQQVDDVEADAFVPAALSRRPHLDLALHQQMLNQLMSSLKLGSLASFGSTSAHSTTVTALAGGSAIAVTNRFSVAIVWAIKGRGSLEFACTCGGARGSFCVEVTIKKGVSSCCIHAEAMRRSYEALASQAGHRYLESLVRAFPVLLWTSESEESDAHVEIVRRLRGGREAWAVRVMSCWAALVQPGKSASSQTPRC